MAESPEVTQDTTEAARDAAAAIWAAATAHRDGKPPAEARLARPIIDRALGDSAGSTLLLARAAGRPVGFAVLTSLDREPVEVAYLGVAPEAWGRGVAAHLLAAVATTVATRRQREVVLWVYADNARARRSYEGAGWRADGRSRRHPRTGRTELRYRRDLEAASAR